MATLTSTAVEKPVPRAVETGLVSRTVEYNSGSTSMSAGDVLLVAPIPNNATILDFISYHSNGASTMVMDFGVQGNASAFASGVTAGTVGRATLGIPYDVSVSDDAVANRFVNFVAKVASGSSTTSGIVKVTVLYTMDK